MIHAIILAAGQSKRMGQPKMLLPWGNSTVLQTVIEAFSAAGVEAILVITGAGHDQIERLVGRSAQTVFNPGYAEGEMLSSVQAGLRALAGQSEAALIALGDQPQIQVETIKGLLEAYSEGSASIIVPSYENHRGHPWLVGSQHWQEIIHMSSPGSMRDFFRSHHAMIRYIPVSNASVLADLDTPEDYLKYRR